jgi:serralysin
MRRAITMLLAIAMVGVFALPASADGEPTIFDITSDRNVFDRNDGDFDVLNVAIRVTGLRKALDGPGTFTVFAPTDGAFKETAAALCGDRSGRTEWRATLCLLRELGKNGLKDVLLYHVLPIEADSSVVLSLLDTPLETLQGGSITPSLEGGDLVVKDGAAPFPTVIASDVEASNGVVHVIDGVLLP